MHWETGKVTVYDKERTYIKGWYTLDQLKDVVQTAEYLKAAEKHINEQNLSDEHPYG